MLTMTSVEAQNRFGQLLDTVQREVVAIHPAWPPCGLYRVAARDGGTAGCGRKRGKALADLEAWSAQAAKRATAAAAALTDQDVTLLVHESR
jgi:antitoxin Phd